MQAHADAHVVPEGRAARNPVEEAHEVEALLERMEEANEVQQVAAELGLHVNVVGANRVLFHDVGVQADLDDSDDDYLSDDDQFPGHGRWMPRMPARAPALHRLLRMAAAAPQLHDDVYTSNDRLVSALRLNGAIQSEDVAQALRVCSRTAFVPDVHAAGALRDQPMHLPDFEFNISAPHMHATCLSALALKPGHRFLDVGSGCGVLVACAAFLTGSSGTSVGIDIKECAVEMGRSNVERLTSTEPKFGNAAPTTFFEHNIFVPSPLLRGKFDRVHVGATCPPTRLASLTKLLGPKGGIIVTPVDSELRIVNVAKNGTTTQKCLSRVRYSDLEVPQDCEAVQQVVKAAQVARTCLPSPPSTFASDATDVLGSPAAMSRRSFESSSSDGSRDIRMTSGRASSSSAAVPCAGRYGSSYGSSRSDNTPKSLGGGSSSGSGSPWVPTPMRQLGRMLNKTRGIHTVEHPTQPTLEQLACRADSFSSMRSAIATQTSSGSETARELGEELLGVCDAQLVGQGWVLPVHQSVMQSRCDLWRARAGSGMCDAAAAVFAAPDATPQAAGAALVQYCKTDALSPTSVDSQGLNHLAAVLHLALFFGCARLVSLAEAALAATLLTPASPEFDPCEAAPALVALADDCNLPGLSQAALDYCVHHYQQVSDMSAYAALSQRQTELVTRAACAEIARYKAALLEIGDRPKLPEPDRSGGHFPF